MEGTVFALVSSLHLAALILEGLLFIAIVRKCGLQNTGPFMASNYFLADIWKLTISTTFRSGVLSNDFNYLWILPYVAPIFTLLALPMVLIGCMSQMKSSASYPEFEKTLMKFAVGFVWLLGMSWCGILVMCYLIDCNSSKPFRQFLIIIHTLSVGFCLFILCDIAFHKWRSRRRVHHQTSCCPNTAVTTVLHNPTANQQQITAFQFLPTNQIGAIYQPVTFSQIDFVSLNQQPSSIQVSDGPRNGHSMLPYLLVFLTSGVLVCFPYEVYCFFKDTQRLILDRSTFWLIVEPLCSIFGVIIFASLR